MEIKLTRDQADRIAALAAAKGRTVADALTEAVDAWAERQATLTEIRATLDAADAEYATGGGLEVTPDNERSVMDMIKRDGRTLSATKRQRTALG